MSSNALAAHAAKMAAKYGAPKVSNDPPPVIVPTGIMSLDWALRVGGWQLGRIYELVGPKDSSKSLTSILAMAEHRRMFPDRGVVYINLEKTFERNWAMANGLDCSKAAEQAGTWAPRQAVTTEEASDMARDDLASGLYSCLVIDSVGAMETARVLFEKTAEDGTNDSRRNASTITKLVKALAGLGHQHQCTILLVNQPRASMSQFGGDVPAGPKALTHSTTAQIKMSPLGGEKDVRKLQLLGDTKAKPTQVGHRVSAYIPRMKNGAPGRHGDWFVMRQQTDDFGSVGVDFADDALSIGIRLGAIKQGGAWYTMPGGKRLNGRDAVGAYLRAHPEGIAEIRAAIDFDTPILDPLEVPDARHA